MGLELSESGIESRRLLVAVMQIPCRVTRTSNRAAAHTSHRHTGPKSRSPPRGGSRLRFKAVW